MKPKIHVSVSGNGPAIVYLHGFLETHEIWNDFTSSIGNYTHYAFDLPGFGRSDLPPENFTLEDVATLINKETEALKLSTFHLVGHSLGGYVALAYLKLFPEKIKTVTLFHSTPLPDTAEKKENRTKTIQFIKDNGVEIFARSFVKPLFANPNHEAIAFAEKLAIQAKFSTVTAYLAAMRDRPDRLEDLRKSKVPLLVIAGEKDQVINLPALQKGLENRPKTVLKIVVGVGHMGMLESIVETHDIFAEFLGDYSYQNT
ncbi:MAG: alpha/beta fold hydrolase [Chryseotalea sp.]|jgi:pimeloyl-ACP methyl ester carboxylesterase